MSDDDDFFSNLEAELSQSLDFGSDKPKAEADDGDFFASLQQELGSALDEPPDKVHKAPLQDDFFSNLIDDIADELESSSPAQEPKSKQSSSETQSDDLTSLTVPELKEMLRDKGMKVGGKKAELIERLSQ